MTKTSLTRKGLLAVIILALVGASIIASRVLHKTTLPSLSHRPGLQVVVYGDGTPALAAAWTAAHDGLPTLWLVRGTQVGGLVTESWLTTWDLSRSPKNHLLTLGFFNQLDQAFGGHDSFPLARAEQVMRSWANHTNHLTTLYGVRHLSVSTRQGRVVSISFVRHGRTQVVHAPYVIDASANAVLAKRAGAQFSFGLSSIGLGPAIQASTEIFAVRGVDWGSVLAHTHHWSSFEVWLKSHQPGGLPYSAWGYSNVVKGFQGTSSNVQLRGLNLALQPNGQVLVSGLWLFGVNPLSAASRAKGLALAEQNIPKVVAYLRAHAVGFSKAQWVANAPELYVRQTRQLIAMQTLNVHDLLTNQLFPDDVALGSYPIDIQATQPGQYGLVLGHPTAYGIPLRALIPQGFQNLLVVGRSAGYTPVAAGSARTLPIGIDEGQGAADAVAIADASHVTVPAVSQRRPLTKAMVALIESQGGRLNPPVGVPHQLPVAAWARGAVGYLLDRMAISGGYNNQFVPNTPVSLAELHALFSRTAKGAALTRAETIPWSSQEVSPGLAVHEYAMVVGHPNADQQQLQALGLWPATLDSHWSTHGPLGQLQSYVLAASLRKL